MPWITPTHNTKLIASNEQRDRRAGDRLGICGAKKDGQHWRVKLAGPLTIGDRQVDVVWLWPEHWAGVGEVYQATMQAIQSQAAQSMTTAAPSTFKSFRRDAAGAVVEAVLNIGYKSQTDNRNNPGGSCNVTSIAMGLEYFGLAGRRSDVELEDELYEEMEALRWSRHSPHHLSQIAAAYGMTDSFTSFAKIADIKASIAAGRPCIFHGWFTSFGHIIAAVGFDETGFWVHDPYGEWTADGYRKNNSTTPQRGKYLHYSYGLIDSKCRESDGSFWCHFLDRPGWQPANPVTLTSNPTTSTGSPRKYPPQSFRLNSIATAMIKSYEGLDLDAYLDTEGIPTIGIGTTVYPDGRKVRLGDRITEVEGLTYFNADIDRFINALRELIDVSLTGRQIAALTSFIYNVGIGSADPEYPGLTGSTLRKLINASAPTIEIQQQLRRWNNDGTPGLISRRESECELWQGGDWQIHR
jgi:GH24 family phage-related lysozyme (muramidase)/uncharacterized protein YvpB